MTSYQTRKAEAFFHSIYRTDAWSIGTKKKTFYVRKRCRYDEPELFFTHKNMCDIYTF